MTPQYYKAVLGEDWPGIEDYISYFQERCDSQLEILFALSLVTEFRQAGFNYNGSLEWTSIATEAICLNEPFSCSPSLNGASIAYFKAQIKHGGMTWDFGLFTGDDNGATFEECTLGCLIEIDGWAIHRNQREWDASKSRSAKVRTIRICEEQFLDVREMAEAVLSSTIWHIEDEDSLKASGKLHIFNPNPPVSNACDD